MEVKSTTNKAKTFRYPELPTMQTNPDKQPCKGLGQLGEMTRSAGFDYFKQSANHFQIVFAHWGNFSHDHVCWLNQIVDHWLQYIRWPATKYIFLAIFSIFPFLIFRLFPTVASTLWRGYKRGPCGARGIIKHLYFTGNSAWTLAIPKASVNSVKLSLAPSISYTRHLTSRNITREFKNST